jgi:riboflavin biosynthesis pyrimidine reductase
MTTTTAPPATAARFEALVQAPAHDGSARGGLTRALRERYGSDLWIPLRDDRPTVIANFVSTLDGVVSFQTPDAMGGGEISGFFEPDRFVMGLLRTLADAVLVGAGTLRAAPKHRWIPEHVNRASAPEFAQVRANLGLAPFPLTAVLTSSGDIDLSHPGLNDDRVPVVLITTDDGAARLSARSVPSNVEVFSLGKAEPRPAAVVELLARRGATLVLSEGGPHLIGQLMGADLIDELFLTIAPQIAGRDEKTPRLALVEGQAFEVNTAPWFDLITLHRNGDHLFNRYRARGAAK